MRGIKGDGTRRALVPPHLSNLQVLLDLDPLQLLQHHLRVLCRWHDHGEVEHRGGVPVETVDEQVAAPPFLAHFVL